MCSRCFTSTYLSHLSLYVCTIDIYSVPPNFTWDSLPFCWSKLVKPGVNGGAAQGHAACQRHPARRGKEIGPANSGNHGLMSSGIPKTMENHHLYCKEVHVYVILYMYNVQFIYLYLYIYMWSIYGKSAINACVQ